MAKRLSDSEKEQITNFFILGKTLSQLSQEFNCTKLTISRNLKKNLGEKKYKELTNKIKKTEINAFKFNKSNSLEYKFNNDQKSSIKQLESESSPISPFVEIAPLNYEIDITSQKDLASIPISEFEFPNLVYMIVDKKIELEIKYIRDYPKWEFLSQDELERKSIEIYFDSKIAKAFCGKEQKVIKVPNTEVFKKTAHILLSRGISRIVSSNNLIAL